MPARSRVVCSCHGVTESAIAACARGSAPGHALARVQDALRCGTGCGSCVPEVRQIVADATRQAA